MRRRNSGNSQQAGEPQSPQDSVHRGANNPVEMLLSLTTFTKFLFVALAGGHLSDSGGLGRPSLIVTMSKQLSKNLASS